MKNIDDTIKNCTACGVFPKLKDNFIQLRKSNILVLGESPAKDGWLKSGRAFFNSNGELQASGKVLNKLLNMCSLSIDDINFTECCKCIIENRKRLRECINNCKPILFSQIGSNIVAGYLTALGYWSLCQLQIISENNVVSLFPIVAGNFEIQKLIILIVVLVIMILGTVLSIIKINH